MNHIDKIIYINLDRRQDRRADTEAEFAKMEFVDYERFSALEFSPGIVGCSLSHQSVLKLARKRGYRNILIIEDDFEFRVNRDRFDTQINAFFESIPNYDVLMLGYNEREGRVDAVPGFPELKRVVAAQTAACYLINGKYFGNLIELYDFSIPKLIKTGEHWKYANDQVWKILQEHDRWFCFSEKMGIQRAGFSDNAMCFMEYDT